MRCGACRNDNREGRKFCTACGASLALACPSCGAPYEAGERFDPEQWFRIVEDFFKVAADGVHRSEGTVNQFTGDGMMALFGAPISHEDHAQRACLAALHIRGAVHAFAEDVFARHGVRFDIRMGVNSGEVMRTRWTFPARRRRGAVVQAQSPLAFCPAHPIVWHSAEEPGECCACPCSTNRPW